MKDTLKLLFFAIIVMVFNRCKHIETQRFDRPNVLFVLVDDQRNDVLSAAGHSIIKTPTIDKLAQRGMMFTNTFVITSICAASRASTLTGLYESGHNFTFGK